MNVIRNRAAFVGSAIIRHFLVMLSITYFMSHELSIVIHEGLAGNYGPMADIAAVWSAATARILGSVFVTRSSPGELGLAKKELALASQILSLELSSFEATCKSADKATFANRVRWLGQALERTYGCLLVLRVQLENIHEPWVTKVKADVERLLE